MKNKNRDWSKQPVHQIPLFPTNVYIIKNIISDDYNQLLLDRVYELEKETPSKFKSNTGGFHSHEFLPQDKLFENLFNEISTQFFRILKRNVIGNREMGITKVTARINTILRIDKLSIPHGWININRKRNCNARHSHPGCWYSGVYYVKKPKNSGELMMVNNHNSVLEENADIYFNEFVHAELKPSTGDLVLFPSHLEHSVQRNISNKNRYSLAFNYYVRGEFGREEYKLEIK